jgi:hypothetical protein
LPYAQIGASANVVVFISLEPPTTNIPGISGLKLAGYRLSAGNPESIFNPLSLADPVTYNPPASLICLIFHIVTLPLWMLTSLLFGLFFNKYYTLLLIEQGYDFTDPDEDLIIRAKSVLGVSK